MKKPAARCFAGRCRSGGRAFRGGDFSKSTVTFPGGGLNCLARFRLDPTHSLLWPPLLRRNLITVFSAVNTPAVFFSRRTVTAPDARPRAGTGRSAAHARSARRRDKIVFAKRLVLRTPPAREAQTHRVRMRRPQRREQPRTRLRPAFSRPHLSFSKHAGFGGAPTEMRQSAQEMTPPEGGVETFRCTFAASSRRTAKAAASAVSALRRRSARRSRRVRGVR